MLKPENYLIPVQNVSTQMNDDFVNLWKKLYEHYYNDMFFGINDINLGVNYPRPLIEVELVETELP